LGGRLAELQSEIDKLRPDREAAGAEVPAKAREQGREIRIAKLPMTSVARALEVDETRGFMKAIVDAESNQILGAAILGIEGGEIMSAVEIAMMGRLPYTALRDGTFAHPTLVESLNNLFMAMDKA